jgi:hypothetical protein
MAQNDDPFADPFAADPFAQTEPVSEGQPADSLGTNPFVDPQATDQDVMSPFVDAEDAPPAEPVDPLAQAAEGAFSSEDNPFFDPTAPREAIPTTTAPQGEVNPDGIGSIMEFRYTTTVAWDGREVVVRREMTREAAQAFDTERLDSIREEIRTGTLIGYDNSTPPDIWAQWVLYYEQLDLWADFVQRVNLGGDIESPLMLTVRWPGQPDMSNTQGSANAGQQFGFGTNPLGQPGFGGGEFGAGFPGQQPGFDPNFGGGGIADPTISGGFGGPVGGFGGGAFPGQSFGGGGGSSAQIAPVTVQTLQRDVINMYETAVGRVRDLETRQEEFMNEMSARLVDRAERRVALAEWRRERQDSLRDFVVDWDRRYRGSVAMVEGRRFELYRPGAVPADTPVNAFVVVTDTMTLTPFDILNPSDGTVRKLME